MIFAALDFVHVQELGVEAGACLDATREEHMCDHQFVENVAEGDFSSILFDSLASALTDAAVSACTKNRSCNPGASGRYRISESTHTSELAHDVGPIQQGRVPVLLVPPALSSSAFHRMSDCCFVVFIVTVASSA